MTQGALASPHALTSSPWVRRHHHARGGSSRASATPLVLAAAPPAFLRFSTRAKGAQAARAGSKKALGGRPSGGHQAVLCKAAEGVAPGGAGEWSFRGHRVNYTVSGAGPPVLLVHGFGASVGHWRRNIPALEAAGYTVYAVDLLGFGASAKPLQQYSMEGWRDQLLAFLAEVVGEPAVIVGNSIGSLACVMTAAAAPEGALRGVVLVNCAGGMNNKAVSDDWRIKVAMPVFKAIDFLLNRPRIAKYLFDKYRSKDNIRNVLEAVYVNKGSVDDELVDIIYNPSEDENALETFVSIITGPPGPRPQDLVGDFTTPILLLWGDEDPFTPLDGPVGKFFLDLPNTREGTEMVVLEAAGHCPHDDNPEALHKELLPWLSALQ